MLPFVSICDGSNSLRLPIWCIPVLLAINSQRGNQSKFGNRGNGDSRFLTINQKIFHCTRKTPGFGTEGHRIQCSAAFPQCCLPVRESSRPCSWESPTGTHQQESDWKPGVHRCETPPFRIQDAPCCLLTDHNPTSLFLPGLS